ncbi:S1 RNA-binding domain-containing protein [Pontibacillus yanchengensis]|uniref:S1 RNA-binding domain-containing protein n=2 Tax=Pontibacillus yanchengensis TaxID=462910 RepID=A0ACC7VL15_9BACI|nr:S1 RNA-binding domain-containing protein [Pontibacillus yanchengensis]MYL35486.1 S1 RNA-binding domain-containing protein [Pontibacillus yanchengensis]MYL55686.1 S1 RNA-binding domain-containing protein [Pontibacillus yanchengensis]
MNNVLLEMLRESAARKWVQYGEVETIRDVTVGNQKEKLIIINYQGEFVYCKEEDFEERKLGSYQGFMQTRVPFTVKDITEDENGSVITVSRIEGLKKVAEQFIQSVREGDVVKGTVTGVDDNGLVFLEVNGYPCIIPPGQWSIERPPNLKETTPIGTVVEAKVLTVDALENKQKTSVSHRVRLSRRDLQINELEERWKNIDAYYKPNDNVSVKITGQAVGHNSYFCELPNGISIIGNLTSPLRDKYNDYLPPGVKATGVIKFLDKDNRRGKMIIRKVEANHANILQNQTFGAL